ncbi:alpha/beta fold hydrolase [Mycetocola zhadangensis]|uniref:alpha/beta fold hydrolase n=1 Tax=Mycetocola zhadangensis TaxID=1164595 RepID=UPI003A4E25DA
MPYLSIAGTEIYSEIIGEGEPLLLLHGGFCSLFHLQPYADVLAERFAIAAYERPGNGRSADTDGPYSYDTALEEAVAYLDRHNFERVHVLGFSDGAILGLLLALKHPDRVRSLVSISGNLDPSGITGDDKTDAWERPHVPDSEEPTPERVHYSRLSPDGPEHADVVLDKLMSLWTTEPHIAPSELAAVTAPSLIISGDRDMIRVDHSHLMATSLPNGQLCILPGATHSLVSEKPDLLHAVLRDFYEGLGETSR